MVEVEAEAALAEDEEVDVPLEDAGVLTVVVALSVTLEFHIRVVRSSVSTTSHI